MKLLAGTEIRVRNLETREEAPFYIGLLQEYQGQYIVYGGTKAHWFRNWRGVIYVKGRPGCFVVLPHETPTNITKLVVELGGLPLALQQGQDLLFIVNCKRIPGFWDGDAWNKHDMLRHAARIVELYFEWKRLGKMPNWFVRLRQAARVA